MQIFKIFFLKSHHKFKINNNKYFLHEEHCTCPIVAALHAWGPDSVATHMVYVTHYQKVTGLNPVWVAVVWFIKGVVV